MMATILASATATTAVYAGVTITIRWIEHPERKPTLRIASWVVLIVVLAGAAVIAAADRDVVIGFCVGGLLAPVLMPFLTRKPRKLRR